MLHPHTPTHSTTHTSTVHRGAALQFYGRCDTVCRPPPVHPVIDAVIDAEAVRRPPPVHPVIDAVVNAQAAEGKEAAQQYTATKMFAPPPTKSRPRCTLKEECVVIFQGGVVVQGDGGVKAGEIASKWHARSAQADR